ncbi:hypothetical protein Sps_03452 [Shewanella psychrophila]|uniref:Bacteriophage lambda head decoration protein D n=1 Tax=Shewanella psychrophila TaxID=225848 RepID=A0A1S6HSU1_9GAMM|nr:hypothetical protein [Shewanella psychrophila]AQS38579.1 hypothetical protein Sps_03452 [Shewanella psychrophila]
MLTQDRATPTRANHDHHDPMAATVLIYAGAIVMLDAAGNAVAGQTATGLTPRGVARVQVDNTQGIAGAESVPSVNGCHRFINDASITRADIGSSAYVVDDETVADSDGGGTRSMLGNIIDVDVTGVWVDIV